LPLSTDPTSVDYTWLFIKMSLLLIIVICPPVLIFICLRKRTKKCQNCAEKIAAKATKCDKCGFVQNVSTRGMINKVLGMAGSAFLLVGVFLPFFHIPIMGSINYFQNGKGDGVVVFLMAIISFVLSLANKFKWLWATIIISTITLCASYVSFQLQVSKMKAGMEAELSGNPFRGFADMAMASYQIEWGAAIIVIGIVLLIAAVVIKPELATNPSHPIGQGMS